MIMFGMITWTINWDKNEEIGFKHTMDWYADEKLLFVTLSRTKLVDIQAQQDHWQWYQVHTHYAEECAFIPVYRNDLVAEATEAHRLPGL